MAVLDGKVALVTGGGSGIGLATARLLVERGAVVALVDRNRAAATEVAEELGGLAVEADVSRSGRVARDRRRRDLGSRWSGPRPPERRSHHGRGGCHPGDGRHLPAGGGGERRRGVLRRAGAGPGHGRPRRRGHRGHCLVGRSHRLLPRPHLLHDQARGRRSRPVTRPSAGHTRHHRERRMPGIGRHAAYRRFAPVHRAERLPAHRRVSGGCRRGRPHGRRGVRRLHGHPGRDGSRWPSVSPDRRDREGTPLGGCRRPSWPPTIRSDRSHLARSR